MTRTVITSLLTLLLASPAFAQAPRDPVVEAVNRGLVYLASTQGADGGWSSNRGFGARNGEGDLAITALSVMAFLSAGHVPGEGPYREQVDRGIRFVGARQGANGLFAARFGGNTEMYYHGICTLMLAEAVGLMDRRASVELMKKLEAAVKVILQAQRTTGTNAGGWRYTLNGFDADLSVTGWQMMALRAAKNVGCDVPADRIRAAVEYVRRSHDPRTGGYTYTVPGGVTVPCTGTGILAMELCGKEHHATAEAVRAASYLLKNPIGTNPIHFYYGVYYTSQGMFQIGTSLGTNYWKSFRDQLHRALLFDNPQQQNGAWGARGVDTAQGQAYCTAMAILALTVEYRFLPIYQRFEEPMERDGTEK